MFRASSTTSPRSLRQRWSGNKVPVDKTIRVSYGINIGLAKGPIFCEKRGELIITAISEDLRVKDVHRGSRAGEAEYGVRLPDGRTIYASAWDVVPPNDFLRPGNVVVLRNHGVNGATKEATGA